MKPFRLLDHFSLRVIGRSDRKSLAHIEPTTWGANVQGTEHWKLWNTYSAIHKAADSLVITGHSQKS